MWIEDQRARIERAKALPPIFAAPAPISARAAAAELDTRRVAIPTRALPSAFIAAR